MHSIREFVEVEKYCTKLRSFNFKVSTDLQIKQVLTEVSDKLYGKRVKQELIEVSCKLPSGR